MVITDGNRIISDGDVSYITSDARMPILHAYYCASGADAYSKVDVESFEWTIEVSSLKLNNLPLMCPTIVRTVSGTAKVNITDVIKVMRGGLFTVRLSDECLDCGTGRLLTTRSFQVLGTNPTAAAVRTELEASTPLWYAVPVAHHETLEYGSFRQFFPNGPRAGWPVVVRDNGTGIMQLTVPFPTCRQAWDWKANVAGGVLQLQQAHRYAAEWMARQRAQALAETGAAVAVPSVTESNCEFRERGPRIITDAVALKRYNGASRGNYCSWDNANSRWKFNQLNSLGFNYVNRVCRSAEPEESNN